MQVLGADNIPTVVVASTTTVTLAATNKGTASAVTVGGQQYSFSSGLTLNTGTTGAGGLDTGTLGAIQLWYVYLVRSLSTFQPALIASQAGPGSGPLVPSGYGTAWAIVGAFYTNGSSQVGSIVAIVGTAISGVMSFTPSINAGLTTSTASAQFRRNGDVLEVTCGRYVFTNAGTVTQVRSGLPGALTIDTARLNSAFGSGDHVGTAGFYNNSALYQVYPTASNAVSFTTGSYSDINGNTIVNTNQIIFRYTVPVVGWTATLF